MLVAGQTRCGKTSLVPKQGKSKIFGSIDSVDWISKIEFSEAREHQIRESFCYASVELHYPNDVDDFETILELLKDVKDVNDVSGLADKSNKFCSFLRQRNVKVHSKT